MQAYFFDNNGWYVGTHEVMADPLHPSQYLVPSNGTLIQPPTPGPNQKAKWATSSWTLADDPAVAAAQEAAAAATQAAQDNQVVVYYRNETGKDTAVVFWQSYSKAMIDGVLTYRGLPMTDSSNSKVSTIILAAETDTSAWFTAKGLPAKKVVIGAVFPREQSDIGADDPDFHAVQLAKTVVFYRNATGKDNNVLLVTTWGQCASSWDAAAPNYEGKPLTDPDNAEVSYLVLDSAPVGADAKNANGIPAMMVSGTSIVARDPASVAAEDTVALDKRLVVFWRNETGKDTKVISIARFGDTKDSSGNVLYREAAVPATVGYTIFDTDPVGIDGNRNAQGVATLKVVSGAVAARDASAISVDCDNKAYLTSSCQTQIDALLAPKENTQHLMEALADVWEVMLGLMTELNVTSGQLSTTAQTSYTNNQNRMSQLFAQIQSYRTQRDTAIAALEPAD